MPRVRGHVLDGDRQSVEWSRLLPARQRGVGGPGRLQRRLRQQRDDGVHPGVHRLNAREEPAHELLGAELASDEPPNQLTRRGEDDLRVAGHCFSQRVHRRTRTFGERDAGGCRTMQVLHGTPEPSAPVSTHELGEPQGTPSRRPDLQHVSGRIVRCFLTSISSRPLVHADVGYANKPPPIILFLKKIATVPKTSANHPPILHKTLRAHQLAHYVPAPNPGRPLFSST